MSNKLNFKDRYSLVNHLHRKCDHLLDDGTLIAFIFKKLLIWKGAINSYKTNLDTFLKYWSSFEEFWYRKINSDDVNVYNKIFKLINDCTLNSSKSFKRYLACIYIRERVKMLWGSGASTSFNFSHHDEKHGDELISTLSEYIGLFKEIDKSHEKENIVFSTIVGAYLHDIAMIIDEVWSGAHNLNIYNTDKDFKSQGKKEMTLKGYAEWLSLSSKTMRESHGFKIKWFIKESKLFNSIYFNSNHGRKIMEMVLISATYHSTNNTKKEKMLTSKVEHATFLSMQLLSFLDVMDIGRFRTLRPLKTISKGSVSNETKKFWIKDVCILGKNAIVDFDLNIDEKNLKIQFNFDKEICEIIAKEQGMKVTDFVKNKILDSIINYVPKQLSDLVGGSFNEDNIIVNAIEVFRDSTVSSDFKEFEFETSNVKDWLTEVAKFKW